GDGDGEGAGGWERHIGLTWRGEQPVACERMAVEVVVGEAGEAGEEDGSGRTNRGREGTALVPGSLVAAVYGRGRCRWYVLITSSSPRLTDPDLNPRSNLGAFLRQHESEEGNGVPRRLLGRYSILPPPSTTTTTSNDMIEMWIEVKPKWNRAKFQLMTMDAFFD
ncbi:unnamed protein product, partial [Musa acuminata var. zebrina]